MKARQRGYSVVELITVMVLVGILAAIAIPRMMSIEGFSGSAYRNEVASALRHAQKSAVSHRRLVCASLTSSTVTLAIATGIGATACNSAYASPDGSAYASRDGTITAGGSFVGNTLYFQPSGAITTDGAGVTNASGTITITGQTAIQIEGSTGYVE